MGREHQRDDQRLKRGLVLIIKGDSIFESPFLLVSSAGFELELLFNFTMTTFKQISEDEWQRDDYRPAFEVWCYADELFPNTEVDYFEHYEEGLGPAKSAFFLTSNNRQFFVTELLERPVPLTSVGILNDKKTWEDDFEEVLKLLHLKRETLGYVFNW